MIRTTRINTTQSPAIYTYDLSSQMNGRTQTFTLPAKVEKGHDQYLIFNSTIYRNDVNHTFYVLSDDGISVTTFFDTAPMGGAAHALQLVVNEIPGDSDFVTRAEMLAAIEEAINKLKEDR